MVQRVTLLTVAAALLAGCASPPRPAPVNPDAVRAEIEALRKKVARLKAEFNSGKRY